MKIARSLSFVCLAFVSFSGVAVVRADGDHESCACAAIEEGFTIQCEDNQPAMNAALGFLTDPSNNCESDCSSEICHRNYLIIQSHHDHCLDADLPPTLEDTFHLFEAFCEECEISKVFDPSLPTCPSASCEDDTGTSAYSSLLSNSCATDCSSNTCRSHYRRLKVVHDTCEEDTLSPAAEAAFHEFEEACEALHGCNLPNIEDLTPLICDELTSAVAPVSLSLAAGFLAAVAFWVTGM